MTKTAWRYEIKYGPEGEANYAWVYDADGEMVCTAKTHHAKAIVTRMNALASLQGEDAVERVALRRTVLDILNSVAPAVENLACNQEQADADGCMVKVSRQAVDEVLAAVNEVAIQAATATGLVAGEAAIRAAEREKCEHRVEELDCLYINDERCPFGGIPADPETTLLRIISDILEKTGLSAKPMRLSDLGDAIVAEMERRVAAETSTLKMALHDVTDGITAACNEAAIRADERERCAQIADNAFGGEAHNGRSGGMSDNIVNLGDIRAERSADGRDWTPLELLRKLVKDIEDGVRTPDRIYVAMTEKLDDDSTYYPYFSAGMNSIECVGLLAQHLHFRSML